MSIPGRCLHPVSTLQARRLALCAVLLIVATPVARSAERATNLTDDIRFAQDLARWRYFDLAVEWLAQIERRPDLDPPQRIAILLQKGRIALLAAEVLLPTRGTRETCYADALGYYAAAIAAMPAEMTAEKGEAIVDGLARVHVNEGKFHAEEVERQRAAAAPESEIAAALTAAEQAFGRAITTLNTATVGLEEASRSAAGAEQQSLLHQLALFAQFRKGESCYFRARIYPPQDFKRQDDLTKCIESLVDFIWEAGDDSDFLTANAYYYQGMAEFELGRIPVDDPADHDEKALASLMFIVSPEGIDLEQVARIEDEGDRAAVLGLFERACHGVAQIYHHAAGRIEGAADLGDSEDLAPLAVQYGVARGGRNPAPWQVAPPVLRSALVNALRAAAIHAVDDMETRIAEHGLELGPDGAAARLQKARTLLAQGDGARALDLVKDVAQAHGGTAVGVEARKLLAELLESVDAADQPPGVLRIAAEGLRAGGRNAEAIDTWQRVVRACTTPEQKQEHLPDAWLAIGQIHTEMGRHLEAAHAFEQGIAAAREVAAGDETIGDLASRAYGAWNRRFVETKADSDRKQRDRVREMVIQLGASADLQYFVAKEAYSDAAATAAGSPEERKRAFLAALAAFEQVPQESVYFERAQVYRARCLAAAGDLEAALAAYDALVARAGDPNFGVALDARKTAQRRFALAEATHYRADALRKLGRFDAMLETLAGYEASFPDQQAFLPNVEYLRIVAHVGRKDLAAAHAILDRMTANDPDDRATTLAFSAVATGHHAAYMAIAEARRASEEALGHLRAAADHLAESNARSGYDSFQNLQTVADWYKAIADHTRDTATWTLAAENYARLVRRYGEDPSPELQATIARDVKRDLAEVLLALREFVAAEPLWAEQYGRAPKDRSVVRHYALCLGGWLDETRQGDGYAYAEITGVGEYARAKELWVLLKKGIEDAGDAQSSDWWEANVDFLYCQYMQAKVDPSFKAGALKLIDNWRATSGRSLDAPANAPWKRRIDRLELALQS